MEEKIWIHVDKLILFYNKSEKNDMYHQADEETGD